jgi:hypothetical protein
VIAKLQFFQSMHNVRTCFRAGYSVGLLVLAADGLTAKQKLNHQEYVWLLWAGRLVADFLPRFWVDIFFTASV